MLNFLKNKPKHDFNLLADVLKGTKKSEKVLYGELLVDEEIKKVILEEFLEDKYFPPPVISWGENKAIDLLNFNEKKSYYKNYYESTISFYYKMGYSMIPDMMFMYNFESLNPLNIKSKDTAGLSKGSRHWAVEGTGIIKTWEDFEKFPWNIYKSFIEEYLNILEMTKGMLPDGMKFAISGTFFEEPLEWIFGYENMFFLMVDNPDLVSQVYSRVGEIVYDFYKSAIDHKNVGCIFHADDLGYKSGTLISVKDLKKLVFPWFKKYSELAHDANKPFFLHSCGKKHEIMDILINDVKIDAIHSFEDASYPVTEYITKWGSKVGIMGGVDIDKLVRLDEKSLRSYIKSILDFCVPKGRYICGTGNSVANYVPIKNYLILLEECNNWNKL
jgi:uroporphyrinogen decarboxylase